MERLVRQPGEPEQPRAALRPTPQLAACREAFAELIGAATAVAATTTNLARLVHEYRRTERRVRALENMAYVVAANQAASLRHYPPFSWPGGSMVVDYDGRILAQADPGPHEKIVVGPVDLAALRAERQRRRGHAMPAHLRTEAYPAYRQSIYPPGGARDGAPTVEKNEAATRRGREALKRLDGQQS